MGMSKMNKKFLISMLSMVNKILSKTEDFYAYKANKIIITLLNEYEQQDLINKEAEHINKEK